MLNDVGIAPQVAINQITANPGLLEPDIFAIQEKGLLRIFLMVGVMVGGCAGEIVMSIKMAMTSELPHGIGGIEQIAGSVGAGAWKTAP